MLHTLHRSAWLTDFSSLLRLIDKDDELLLLQDGEQRFAFKKT